MDHPDQDELVGTIGTDEPRRALLQEIVDKIDGLDPAATDEDLDRWWGEVKIDRLASGLTLATIASLAAPNEGELRGPWLSRADKEGDAPTSLTPEGRQVLRRTRPVRLTS